MRRTCLIKHAIEGKIERREDEKEEDVSSYWMTLKKREDTGKAAALDHTL
jgi:hypothetical protein